MTGTGVTWTSSNTAVATIDATGRATGVGPGTTTITATDSLRGKREHDAHGPRPDHSFGRPRRRRHRQRELQSAGISCGTDCSETYDSGTSVTLTATAASGSTFFGWIGCDTVSGATCTVTMSAARTVTATFDPQRFVLTVNRTGLLRLAA